MFLVYSVIFCVFAKSINCYNPKRQPRVTATESVYIDNFPEVEYPGSITDTIKPFYLNSNPFSSDVQSSFKALKSGGTTKSRPTIILNIHASDNSKDKKKHKLVTSEKAIQNEVKNIPEKDINSNIEKTNNKPLIVLFENDSSSQEMDKEVTSREEEESSIDSEMEYNIEFIDNLDNFTTTREIETEFIDINSSSMQIFDDEHSNEIETITSDVPSINNFVEESNERSSQAETSVFDEVTNNSTVITWLVNDGFTDSSGYNDTDLFIAKISNDTDIL